ncbi:MAG: hypothetical protein IPP69_09225 [Flavobacteriales bacterium]|nr:hypothetical protein [Flavobacteriales bacterium]
MPIRIFFINILVFFFALSARAQEEVREKVNQINQWYKEHRELAAVDDNLERISELNAKMTNYLLQVLNDPKARSYPLEKWLNLDFVQSSDKKIVVFSWSEKTGGSNQTNINIIYVELPDGYPKGEKLLDCHTFDKEQSLYTGQINQIYDLKLGEKMLYLLMGSGISCNTCCYDYTVLYEINDYWLEESFCVVHDYRQGDGKYSFDEKSRTLLYDFTIDSDDPLYKNDCAEGEKLNEKTCRYLRKYQFNGNTFEEVIK